MGEAAVCPCSKEGFTMIGHSWWVRAGGSPPPLYWDICVHFAVLQNKKEVKKKQNVEWEATEVMEDLFCQETREKVSWLQEW